MRLSKIAIDNFKNLNNFSVDFDQQSLTTVIIGRNGTGKSNLLEALIIIFRDLDLGESPAFKYMLSYNCRGHEIQIDADPQRSKREQVLVTVNGDEIPYRRFWQQSNRYYLPSNVFGYYSGLSNRMEVHFEKHQERFYDDMIHGGDEKHLRPLFYSRLVHSQFVLLSFFTEQDEAMLNFLKTHLRIEGLDSILFVMKKPPWKSEIGDPRFWYARGEVQKFLSKLYELSLAPLRIKQRINLGFKETKTLEHLYLYLQDVNKLRILSSLYRNQQEFFTALESTYISELIREVRIKVKIQNVDGSLTYRDLSEGEQQLLMVLGLLHFTKEDESLFLLDEPDTHLNPVWSIQYLELLGQVVGDNNSSHIIMTTHNPLVIAGLERSQVQIMQRDDETDKIFAEMPEEDPKGMGIAAILTSDLFGLRSTLDLATQRLVDERRELTVKEELTAEEKIKLGDLNKKLEGLDFTITTRDSLYGKFMRAMIEREDPSVRQQIVLTPEQQEEQRQLTRSVLSEIIAEEQKQV